MILTKEEFSLLVVGKDGFNKIPEDSGVAPDSEMAEFMDYNVLQYPGWEGDEVPVDHYPASLAAAAPSGSGSADPESVRCYIQNWSVELQKLCYVFYQPIFQPFVQYIS